MLGNVNQRDAKLLMSRKLTFSFAGTAGFKHMKACSMEQKCQYYLYTPNNCRKHIIRDVASLSQACTSNSTYNIILTNAPNRELPHLILLAIAIHVHGQFQGFEIGVHMQPLHRSKRRFFFFFFLSDHIDPPNYVNCSWFIYSEHTQFQNSL